MISLVLAAGRGRRAGGPKAWAAVGGRTLLERQLDFLLARRRPEQVLVSVQEAWLARCRTLAPGVCFVATDPDADAAASLRALLAAAPRGAWASVHHADMPVWESGLWAALEAVASAGGAAADAVVPTHLGRRGHPVLLSPAAQRGLLARADPPRLDRWLAERRVAAVEGPWACCLENWNAPLAEARP